MVEKVIFSGITLKRAQSILRRVNKYLNGKGSEYTFTLYRTPEPDEFVISFEDNIKADEFLTFCHVFFKYAATKVSKVRGWFEASGQFVIGLPTNRVLMVAPSPHTKRFNTMDDLTIISDNGKSYMDTTMEYSHNDPVFQKNPVARQVYETEKYVSSINYTAYPYPILYKIDDELSVFYITRHKKGFFNSIFRRIIAPKSLSVEREKFK
jgi:hypothetical protein